VHEQHAEFANTSKEIILPQVMKLLIYEIHSVSLLGCTTLFLSTAWHFY